MYRFLICVTFQTLMIAQTTSVKMGLLVWIRSTDTNAFVFLDIQGETAKQVSIIFYIFTFLGVIFSHCTSILPLPLQLVVYVRKEKRNC